MTHPSTNVNVSLWFFAIQIALDNAVARLTSNAEKLQASGETMGDPFEISRIRREDFQIHQGRTEGDHILQSLNQPSSKTLRGHQGPAAFLIKASALEKVWYIQRFAVRSIMNHVVAESEC